MNQADQGNIKDGTVRRGRKRRWLGYAMLLLGVIAVLLYIVQVTINQTWGTQRVAHYLSSALNTEVSIGDISLNVLKGVEASEVLILDHRSDTLIYAGHFKTGLQSALASALSRKLVLSDVEIQDGLFNLVTYQGDDRKNLNMTFNPDPAPADSTNKDGLDIELGMVRLKNLEFRNHDYNRGSEEFYHIEDGEIEVEVMNFGRNIIDLGDVCFNDLDVRIKMFTPAGMAEGMTAEEMNETFDSLRQKSPLLLTADHIKLTNSRFKLDNNFRSPDWNQNYERINYDHLYLDSVELSVRHFKLHDLAFWGNALDLSFQSPTGFELEHLKIAEATVDSTMVSLNGVNLMTPSSSLGDTIHFQFNCYEAWRNFNDNIFIDARLRNSLISFRDIMSFAPSLYDNTFFINSEKEILEVDGRIQGRINSLKAFDLLLNAGDNISFRGDVSTRDITVRGEELLSLDIDELKFDVLSLENLIPGLDIPSNFEKLGVIGYQGDFDGYFEDFVTYGRLSSNLGRARLDMRLDLKPGRDNANYSGKIELQEFDLARWMDNPDFGLLSMDLLVEEGKGLVLENANARVEGMINRLDFKGYSYENVDIDGQLTKNLFDGSLIFDSEDAKLTFNGRISNLNSVPEYQFRADVDHVRLQALKLSEKQFDFGGETDIALTGLSWDELIGQATLKDMWVVYGQQDRIQLEEISIDQTDEAGGRYLKVEAGFCAIDIEGIYDIPTIHQDIINIVGKNHVQLSQLIGIDSLLTETESRKDYKISVDLKNDFDLLEYFTRKEYRLGKVDLEAFVNTQNESLRYKSYITSIGAGNWDLDSVDLSMANDGRLMVYTLNTHQIRIKDKPWFDSLHHVANLRGDSGSFKLSYLDPQNIFESVEIDANMLPFSKQLQIEFKPSALWFGNEKWSFEADNSLLIKKKGLIFDNFRLESDSSYIVLDDLNDGKGISATMQDFNSDALDSLTKLKAFDFHGRFNASISIDNIFDFKGIDFSLWQDETFVNGKNRGGLEINASGRSIAKGVDIRLKLDDGNSRLTANGFVRDEGEDSPVVYQFDIGAREFPLEILEDIITSGISKTKGMVTGDLMLEGEGQYFSVNGNLNIPSGQTTIDYLGVTYYFEDQTIGFKDDYLDFNNTIFTDSLGNEATVTGGLRHRSFKDWALDLSIRAPRLIGLNTTKYQNPSYYGFAVGEVKIDFYGSMDRPNIDVVATTASPSEMIIPISYGTSDLQTGFVEFVKIDTLNRDTIRQRATNLTGLELDMKLTVTEAAKTKIIFDEQAGDILQGYGRGNINVQVRRTGEMFVYGDYEIEEGDYLFTLLNFVNKPFNVKRGGTIRWTGDPIDAQINIEAEYKGLTASPYPLIQEYLASGQNVNLESQARRSTRVDLTMGLSGSLLSPRITFDIDMPNLVGELNTYVENKLQALKSDQERLNQQVFGLVVFGSFLPSNQTTALVNNIGASTINTFSEFLSTQLSVMFSSLLTDAVDDVKFISGVDVDLAYVQQQFELQSDQQANFSEGEYQFRFKNRLWNDKWVITLGGDYSNQSLYTSDPYFNPETVIEWNTPVNGLKLRVYYRAEQNFQGQIQKVGGGITYRKEFNSFLEFKNAVEDIKEGKSK